MKLTKEYVSDIRLNICTYFIQEDLIIKVLYNNFFMFCGFLSVYFFKILQTIFFATKTKREKLYSTKLLAKNWKVDIPP